MRLLGWSTWVLEHSGWFLCVVPWLLIMNTTDDCFVFIWLYNSKDQNKHKIFFQKAINHHQHAVAYRKTH